MVEKKKPGRPLGSVSAEITRARIWLAGEVRQGRRPTYDEVAAQSGAKKSTIYSDKECYALIGRGKRGEVEAKFEARKAQALALIAEGKLTQAQIAKQLGVHESRITRYKKS